MIPAALAGAGLMVPGLAGAGLMIPPTLAGAGLAGAGLTGAGLAGAGLAGAGLAGAGAVGAGLTGATTLGTGLAASLVNIGRRKGAPTQGRKKIIYQYVYDDGSVAPYPPQEDWRMPPVFRRNPTEEDWRIPPVFRRQPRGGNFGTRGVNLNYEIKTVKILDTLKLVMLQPSTLVVRYNLYNVKKA